MYNRSGEKRKVIQVKEFLNYKNNEQLANEWLSENHCEIEVIDMKYAVSTFQESEGNEASEYSGILIIYKTTSKNTTISNLVKCDWCGKIYKAEYFFCPRCQQQEFSGVD